VTVTGQISRPPLVRFSWPVTLDDRKRRAADNMSPSYRLGNWGTDSHQGHSPRWLMARVMARVLISDDYERWKTRENPSNTHGLQCLSRVGRVTGIRTRTVSLGGVLISPCFCALQGCGRPQLASSDPCRPSLVACVWPLCGQVLSLRVVSTAHWPKLSRRGSARPSRVSHYRVCETGTVSA
jgi:hypothetical protein